MDSVQMWHTTVALHDVSVVRYTLSVNLERPYLLIFL